MTDDIPRHNNRVQNLELAAYDNSLLIKNSDTAAACCAMLLSCPIGKVLKHRFMKQKVNSSIKYVSKIYDYLYAVSPKSCSLMILDSGSKSHNISTMFIVLSSSAVIFLEDSRDKTKYYAVLSKGIKDGKIIVADPLAGRHRYLGAAEKIKYIIHFISSGNRYNSNVIYITQKLELMASQYGTRARKLYVFTYCTASITATVYPILLFVLYLYRRTTRLINKSKTI